MAYRLELQREMQGVHSMLYVPNLNKCLVDATIEVLVQETKFDDRKCYIEEPITIIVER